MGGNRKAKEPRKSQIGASNQVSEAFTRVAATTTQPASDTLNLPSSFTVNEQWLPSAFGLPEKLDIKGTDGKEEGAISGKFFALTPTFNLSDDNGQNVGHASQQLFSWGTKDNFYNAQNKLIGSVQEYGFRRLWDWAL